MRCWSNRGYFSRRRSVVQLNNGITGQQAQAQEQMWWRVRHFWSWRHCCYHSQPRRKHHESPLSHWVIQPIFHTTTVIEILFTDVLCCQSVSVRGNFWQVLDCTDGRSAVPGSTIHKLFIAGTNNTLSPYPVAKCCMATYLYPPSCYTYHVQETQLRNHERYKDFRECQRRSTFNDCTCTIIPKQFAPMCMLSREE